MNEISVTATYTGAARYFSQFKYQLSCFGARYASLEVAIRTYLWSTVHVYKSTRYSVKANSDARKQTCAAMTHTVHTGTILAKQKKKTEKQTLQSANRIFFFRTGARNVDACMADVRRGSRGNLANAAPSNGHVAC